VISFDIGGISDIIHDDQNGILIEAFNLESFSRAISAYVDNTIRIKCTSDEIANAAKRKYSEQVASREYQKFYDELIEE
jgi:glycosyltransferase involved in cell wall biosynthesis